MVNLNKLKNKHRIILVVSLIVASTVLGLYEQQHIQLSRAAGNAYYVATNGNNGNSGSINAPWQTISYGVSRLSAGDILYIRGGNYTGGSNVVQSPLSSIPNGTSDTNRVTIAGYPGETATITPPDGYGAVKLNGASYITFQDLVFDGINGSASTQNAFAGGGVHMDGGTNHIRFLRVESKNWVNDGFGSSNNNGASPYLEFINCKSHDNGRDVGNPYSNPGYGLYLNTLNQTIDGCEIYNNHGYGIALNGQNPNDTDNSIIRNNKIYNNVVNPSAGGVGGTTGGGMSIMRGANIQIYNNLVYNNGVGGPSGSSANGMLIYVYSAGTKIYNNTVYNNNGEGISLQYYDSSSPAIVRNNIVYGNIRAIHDLGDLNNQTGSPIIDHNLLTNPSFVNAGALDFHLQSNSPAINTGFTLSSVTTDFDGNTRPAGSAYDIGAYEYAGVVTPPPPPPSMPSIPTGLNATSTTNAITLHWNANSSSENVDTYQAYEGDFDLFLNIPSNQTSYTTTVTHNGAALAPNVTYSFRIGAHNQAGYTDWSNAVSASLSSGPISGDLNLDHIINSVDWSIMNSKWFTTDATSDLNHDGLVNSIDFSILNANWFKTW